MEREKCTVNNVEWKIPNHNIARDSHLEETEYTGNLYTRLFSKQGIKVNFAYYHHTSFFKKKANGILLYGLSFVPSPP